MGREWKVYTDVDDEDDGSLEFTIDETGRLGELFLCLGQIEGRQFAEVESFNAYPNRKGIGTALMRAAVVELKARNIMELWSAYVSPEAMSLRLKLFGETVIQFADGTKQNPIFLPMTVEQYMACDERLEEFPQRSDEILLPNVFVDLSRVNSSDWERPVPLYQT